MTNNLLLSIPCVNQFASFEIGSKDYYNSKLKNPILPNGFSGITIGIGYDLGYHSQFQIKQDWQFSLNEKDLNLIISVSGLTQDKAKAKLELVKQVEVDYDLALFVFENKSLPYWGKSLAMVYPGVEDLSPYAITGLLSLVYNRGTSIYGSRRQEMFNIRALVSFKNYLGIANEIIHMKRYWTEKGLLSRRDKESEMVLRNNNYDIEDLMEINF